MPGILANQDRSAASPPRLKGPDAILPPIYEAFLVEHAVGREEHLAMYVSHVGLLPVERDVQRGIVDVILEALVESDDDVDRGTVVRGGQVGRASCRERE